MAFVTGMMLVLGAPVGCRLSGLLRVIAGGARTLLLWGAMLSAAIIGRAAGVSSLDLLVAG